MSDTLRIVLTGGPGAGKTAVLEMLKRLVCPHVAMLPEAAGILFGGGFWRLKSNTSRKAAQRAIYHVQTQSERLAEEESLFHSMVCDRGTLDGMAYWPDSLEDYLTDLKIDREQELKKYALVLHLKVPGKEDYNHANPLRTETHDQAIAIDERISQAWAGHPHRVVINHSKSFRDKANQAIGLILNELPECCDLAKSIRV